VLQKNQQRIRVADFSATQMHLVQNPRIPMSSPATRMHCQKICNMVALQALKLAQKFKEIVRKFQYKCTHALLRWDKIKKSSPVNSQQTDGACEIEKNATESLTHKSHSKNTKQR
jgi:hypothetical protein